MQTILRNTIRLAALFLLVATVFLASSASAASLPASPCASANSVATCELWALTGTATLYGSTAVNIWGYSASAVGPATMPGPILIVNQGDQVTVTLHNNLPETTAMLFQGQSMIPDTTGVPAGGTKPYTFTASKPGTFLYEAGLVPGSQHQVAMGLYGVLVVRPTLGAGYAYDASTAFAEETALVLSEVDPVLNGSATPSLFDMRKFAPQYFLINGKAYPDTDLVANQIFVTAGNSVLLRYVNAGLQAHAMSSLGLSQKAIAMDGSQFAHPHSMVAETIAPGQTLDTLVTVPASTATGTKFALFDANLLLRNTGGSAPGLGGMLSFLTVGATPPPGPDTTGPLLSSIALAPNPSTGAVPVTLSFNANDSTTGNNNVTAAEYWIDAGAHTSITIGPPAPSVSLTATIPAGLSVGTHVVSVRAQDAVGNWSATGTINLVVDNVGPTSSGLSLTPNPSNGAVSVALSFTASDVASGNSNVTAAEYWVDAGPHQPISVSAPAPVKTLNATIPAGLSAGSHVVSVRSQDALGNWGNTATINLIIDQTGPVTSSVSAVPNPNNGFQGLNTSTPAVRVSANFNDTSTGGSSIAAAEGFIDVVGTTGSGFVFSATDGAFNTSNENGFGDIPLAVIGTLSTGNHTIYIHAKDAAGNWGANSTTVLVIAKSLYFSTFGNTNPPNIAGTADDADIYFWNGSAFSRVIDVTTAPYSLPSGANVDGFDRVDATHFYMSFTADTALPGIGTVQDEDVVYYNNGIWSVYFDGTAAGLTANNLDIDAFNISGGVLYFSTFGNTNPPGVGGTADDADIYSWNGTSFARYLDASTAGFASAANVDGFVRIDATRFLMSFATDTSVPGLGTVQDEDVVYFNAGTWTVYFDGTAQGLTNNNQDIDAFDIP